MTLRPCLAVLALACITPVVAHADTVDNFTATLTDGGVVSGTITFGYVTIPNNQIGGPATISGYEITGDNFTITGDQYASSFSSSAPGPQFFVSGTNNSPYNEFFLGTNGVDFSLAIPGNTPLAAIPNGGICSVGSPCANVNYLGVTGDPIISGVAGGPQVGSGTLSNPAATPEPSSLVLLGTGILGLAGAARRRFTRRI